MRKIPKFIFLHSTSSKPILKKRRERLHQFLKPEEVQMEDFLSNDRSSKRRKNSLKKNKKT